MNSQFAISFMCLIASLYFIYLMVICVYGISSILKGTKQIKKLYTNKVIKISKRSFKTEFLMKISKIIFLVNIVLLYIAVNLLQRLLKEALENSQVLV